ncbi:ketopantoate reductase family protein [Streptomyces marianii]|uniref:Uncharacterized protein n=1 Tax=Streptomyces marianii TaxID=1817406 RepID=A0A5R9EB76_9ACTN|nr:hypothetical protein [Streptomyces marianii]TLQ47278.1 hypothetical protein FEF34_33865 [Streptomyces marianii]
MPWWPIVVRWVLTPAGPAAGVSRRGGRDTEESGAAGTPTFGEWDDKGNPRVERLRAALDAAGVTVGVPDDIRRELWATFLSVAPLGGLGAVTEATIGEFRWWPGSRRLLGEAMAESTGARRHTALRSRAGGHARRRRADRQPDALRWAWTRASPR